MASLCFMLACLLDALNERTFDRIGLHCMRSQVTSFVISNSASLLSSFAADLATPLEPVLPLPCAPCFIPAAPLFPQSCLGHLMRPMMQARSR
eukprot:193043-Rhodomonas_salina.3